MQYLECLGAVALVGMEEGRRGESIDDGEPQLSWVSHVVQVGGGCLAKRDALLGGGGVLGGGRGR